MSDWKWTQIAKHERLTEGPVWDGSALLYNECAASTTYRWDPATGKSESWRTGTGEANGMSFDHQGNLFVCEGDAHRVTQVDAKDPSKPAQVVVDKFNGQTMNWPNDLAISASGRIYFTDPNYNRDKPNNLPHESVYMAERNFGGAWNLTRLTSDTRKPNGVLLSTNQKVLYVAESPPNPADRRQLRAYPVNDNGTLGDHQVLHDFGPGRGIDGMTLTTSGLIVATAGSKAKGPGPMIYVFNDHGRVISSHPTPADSPTNCTFGGDGLDTLFVTFATGDVYQVDGVGMTGQLAYPRRMY